MIKKIVIVFLFIISFSVEVSAEEILSIDDFDFRDSSQVLMKNGYEEINTKKILKELISGNIGQVITDSLHFIKNKTLGDFIFVEKMLLNLMIIIIISAFFTNFASVFSKENISGTAFYICYLAVISVVITTFENICVTATDFLHLLVNYITALVPTFFVSVALVGQASASGFYHIIIIAIGLSQYIFLFLMIPLVKIYLAIGLVNHISKEDLLSKMCDLIKRIVNFGNKLLIGASTGLNVVQGLILPSIDIAKNTTIRKIIGTLPIVGDGIDSYSGILIGSVKLIKNTIGGFAIIVIIILCLVPYIKMQIYQILFQILAAVIQPVADGRLISGLQTVSESIGLLLKIILGNALLFVISIAVICMATSGGT